MLLSVVNTKLRDEYDSLSDLCTALDADAEEIEKTLSALDYHYDPTQNRFI